MLLQFPEDRVFRPQIGHARCFAEALTHLQGSDKVVVTHRGMTRVYDTRQDLHAAILVAEQDVLEAAEVRRARFAMRKLCNRIRARRRRKVLRFLEGAAVFALVVAGAAVATWVFRL